MVDIEITRYKKKKQSGTSHASKKSDHKHSYSPCKFSIKTTWPWRTDPLVELGSYCTICGKVGDRLFLFDEAKAKSFDEENPNAPVFDLSDYCDKLVDLTNMCR